MSRLRLSHLAAAAAALSLFAGTATAHATTPPDDAPDNERTVAIAADGHEIPGVLTLPADDNGDGVVPAVLMLHGFASQKDEVGDLYARQAAALAELGIASLRIDFAGSGDSRQPFTDFTWTSAVGDALTAFDWLVEQPEIDAANVAVLGFSNGGKVGVQIVAERPAAVAFASWSGALYDGSLGDDEAEVAEAAANGSVTRDLGFTVVELSHEYFETYAASTPVADALAAEFDCPLLLVTGTADTVVLPTVSDDFAAAVASTDVTRVEIEGADHIFNVLSDSQDDAEYLLEITANWFAGQLGRAG